MNDTNTKQPENDTSTQINAFFAEMVQPGNGEAFDKAARKAAKASVNDQPIDRLEYLEYLRTRLWKRIRRRVLRRDMTVCRCCDGRATLVHHLSYEEEVMAGNDDSQLVSVCDGCHRYSHFDEMGRKRSPEEANRILLEGRTDTLIPTPKVDLRKSKSEPEYPPEWPRMSSVQRQAWCSEHTRLFYLKKLMKIERGSKIDIFLRRLLHSLQMDDEAIDQHLDKKKTRRRKVNEMQTECVVSSYLTS